MQQQRNKARTPEAVTRCQLWRQMKLPAVMMQGGGEGLGGEGGGKVGEGEKVGANTRDDAHGTPCVGESLRVVLRENKFRSHFGSSPEDGTLRA